MIQSSLTDEITITLVHAFITNRLDYCNSLLCGTCSFNAVLRRLQFIQNAAARLDTLAKKFDHFTPVLQKLHWRAIRQRYWQSWCTRHAPVQRCSSLLSTWPAIVFDFNIGLETTAELVYQWHSGRTAYRTRTVLGGRAFTACRPTTHNWVSAATALILFIRTLALWRSINHLLTYCVCQHARP